MNLVKPLTTELEFHFRKDIVRRYKEHMRKQFSQYIAQHGSFPPNQWRDTIRTYVCAVCDTLAYRNDIIGVEWWAKCFTEIQSPNWYPNDEWRFW